MNLVKEEDLEDDLAVIDEVNAFNLMMMQKAINKQTKGSALGRRANAGLICNMVYDCDLDETGALVACVGVDEGREKGGCPRTVAGKVGRANVGQSCT